MLLLPPPAQVQAALPPIPPGGRGLSKVVALPFTYKSFPVVSCVVYVDLVGLRRLLLKVPAEARPDEALKLLSKGRVRVWVVSTYDFGIGGERRLRVRRNLIRKGWPHPGGDPAAKPICQDYLTAAGRQVEAGEVQSHALEPDRGLWFWTASQGWRLFPDPDLARAYVTVELVQPAEDLAFYAEFKEALGRRLREP